MVWSSVVETCFSEDLLLGIPYLEYFKLQLIIATETNT